MPSRKLMAGVLGVVLFAVGAAVAPATMSAAGLTESTTTVTTDTAPSTTAPVTTTAVTTTTAPTVTTAPVTTTAPTVSAPTTTSAPPPTTTDTVPFAGVQERSLVLGCPVAAVVLLLPARGPLVVGAFAHASAERAGISRLSYRQGGGIVTGSAAAMRENACTPTGAAGAQVSLASVSLFSGAVTADRIALARGASVTAAVSGLKVGGTPITSAGRVPVPGIGYLATGSDVRIPLSKTAVAAGALALHLTSPHAGLPAGSVVVVGAIGLPRATPHAARTKPKKHAIKHKPAHRRPHRHARKAPTGQPLTVTPRLALRHYIFPVAGHADYGDSYGGLRTDVPGNWHHGDDIFAALGTPVVAVSDGTINRVGWEHLGGWRLWVRDTGGDQFYYAHLSGYAPGDLLSNRVRAGQVIGFVGNTGDAFTTPPHLHFEIHPRTLLHLQYNGAVDPTTYLDRWTHLDHVQAPRPVHPSLPAEPQLRSEARYVFRQLLVARHLVPHEPSKHVTGRAPVRHATGRASAVATRQAAAAHGSPSSSTAGVWIGALAVLLLSVSGATFFLRRRRSS